MDLKKLQGYDWSSVLRGVGQVATAFNPAIGGGLIVASQVVETLNQDTTLQNNEVLKNDVIGLTRCSEILSDYLQKKELKQEVNDDNLKLVLVSIQSLDVLFDKTVAIMK
ncbi:hypothetical protein SJPD1_1055 [Sulfurospirillum diekertiae]|uniref:Uncharacterized protein n=1 Tax=Sulfurospirillum diekertiae TaxID=1854492 RepID=A0A290HCI0_9BACT|nr:hypothetical protein [Sulfurospirillum diekertiae]ATB68876.1 hypothetical protein SJPD1_0762 [Sulfurospirillum diekertiae]ATB69167.1 hypothetical protein SJPD1_1055 [Sulfurospirillum diekertiae]